MTFDVDIHVEELALVFAACCHADGTMNQEEFFKCADRIVRDSGIPNFDTLRTRVRQPTSEPSHLAFPAAPLGFWLTCWQHAIFEIAARCSSAAKEFLYSFALGEYDWPQGLAAVALCRLELGEEDHAQVIEHLREELPDMRYESLLRIAGMLVMYASEDARLTAIIEDFRCVVEFDEAYCEAKAEQ